VITNVWPAKRMRLARTVIKFDVAYYAATIPDYNLLTKKQSAKVV
jgi:hypothetical protein